ncbi:MAG: ATP-binding protein [Paludibacteraceae bacterium]|nr:ATP-binding protein [Paludibacteraceae bacterium]
MIERKQVNVLRTRLAEPRRFIQVIAGPRQVGKTTIIGQLITQLTVPHTSISADGVLPDNAEWIGDQWNVVRKTMDLQHQTEHILIIDEVQLLNRWSDVVKREWDADTRDKRNIKLVLLGSSRLLLKDGLNESLAGRFELIHVPHWDFSEMRNAFDISLEQFIYFGSYPGAVELMKDEKRWRHYIRQSIINPAIEKDVLMTKRILKPALLRQVFDMSANHSGELLALNKIVGQLQDAGNTSTVANYIQVLGEAELITGLHMYAPDVARQYQSIPKFQVFNAALQTGYHLSSFEATYMDSTHWGRRVESAVGAHLINYAVEEDYRVMYWRERNDEIDFVITNGDKVLGIEVKSGHRSAGNGLRAFAKRFPKAQTLVVGTGGMPLDLFMTLNPANLF